MVKPVYLVSVNNGSHYSEVVADSRPKKIGRNHNCCFVTPSGDLSISRIQGSIIHTPHDGVHFYHESEKSRTWFGTKDHPLEESLEKDVDVRIACGHVFTFGDNGYQVKVVSYKEMKPVLDKKRRKAMKRLDETQNIPSFDLQNQ
ncbi:hypothetical protein HN451_01155 [archaeon]|nr:hypothetical protein [archaeon]